MDRISRVLDAVSGVPSAPALARLRAVFLSGATGHPYLDDPETLRAYRAYFFPQSFLKAVSVLSELRVPPRQVWDLGAAMGPAAYAAWSLWPNAELHLLDFSSAALADARAIATKVGARITTHVGKLTDAKAPADALVVAANALSEVAFADRVALAQRYSRLCIIEPADHKHARELQQLRDALLPRAPSAPCPHANPCPALERERDFCHQVRAADWPAWHLQLQEEVGLSERSMRFSYLLYENEQNHQSGVRIISNPLKDKGRLRFFGCSKSGLIEIVRQDKNQSGANAALDAIERGALVSLPREDRVTKITADDPVQLLSQE